MRQALGVVIVIALVAAALMWRGTDTAKISGGGVATTTVSDSVSTTTASTTSDTAAIATRTTSSTTADSLGLPLGDLPLSDGQRALAEALGFNVDTMVISEVVMECVQNTLGESRYQFMLAGGTPTWLETARLLPCVRR